MTNVTYSALPWVRGKGIHGWLETEGVVALITGITYQHFGVFSWLSKKMKNQDIELKKFEIKFKYNMINVFNTMQVLVTTSESLA